MKIFCFSFKQGPEAYAKVSVNIEISTCSPRVRDVGVYKFHMKIDQGEFDPRRKNDLIVLGFISDGLLAAKQNVISKRCTTCLFYPALSSK